MACRPCTVEPSLLCFLHRRVITRSLAISEQLLIAEQWRKNDFSVPIKDRVVGTYNLSGKVKVTLRESYVFHATAENLLDDYKTISNSSRPVIISLMLTVSHYYVVLLGNLLSVALPWRSQLVGCKQNESRHQGAERDLQEQPEY